jgi:glycosyltransferase involved in cell wall biosynthesis/MoaA/NifB/PqqE/SkfB family radical SAM enzyme
MRILLQNQYDNYLGGVETYFQLLVDALIEKGHEVITLYTKSGIKPSDTKKGYKAFYLPNLDLPEHDYFSKSKHAALKKDILYLNSIVVKEKPHVIHLNNTHYPRHYNFLAGRVPIVHTVHDFFHCCPALLKMLSESICQKPFGAWCFKNRCISWKSVNDLQKFKITCLNRNAMRNFKKLLVTTEFMRDTLINDGFDGDNVQELPLFIRDWEYNSDYTNDNIIVYAGRLAEEKGVSHFIHMLKALKVNYKAFIIGDGPQKEECINLVNIMGLDNIVQFTGFLSRNSIREYFEKSSVIVIPSVWPEPFCLVGIEAMACSRPVVAYGTGGISSWLSDNYNGFIAPRGDIRGLAHRVETLLKNKRLAEDMGRNGHKQFCKRFTKDKHISALLSVYESVILSKKSSKTKKQNKLNAPEIRPNESLPDYNKRLIAFEVNNRISKVSSYPEEITISTTTKCNMVPPCVICERNLRTRDLEYDIDKDVIEKIMPIFKHADRIYLHCGGEPLAAKETFDIIESVKPPTKIIFNTNGALFTEKTIRYMVDCNVVDIISFSLDAATEKTYKMIRSANFYKIIENIKALIKYRNEKNKDKPLLRPLVLMNFCIFKRNLKEVPDYVLLAHSLGADGIDFSHLNQGFDWKQKRDGYVFDYKNESVLCMKNPEQHDKLISKAYKLGKMHNMPINFNGNPFITAMTQDKSSIKNDISEVIKLNKKCFAPWSGAVIETDGRVRMCCIHHSCRGVIGKLRCSSCHANGVYLESDTFDEIWNGKEAISVRKEFINKGIADRCITDNPCIFQNRV